MTFVFIYFCLFPTLFGYLVCINGYVYIFYPLCFRVVFTTCLPSRTISNSNTDSSAFSAMVLVRALPKDPATVLPYVNAVISDARRAPVLLVLASAHVQHDSPAPPPFHVCMAGYNITRSVDELLETNKASPPSFSVHFYPEHWTLNSGSKFLYNNQVAVSPVPIVHFLHRL